MIFRQNWIHIVGLTGGFGSGKSTVLSLFKQKGAYTLDADKIVHQLLKKDRWVIDRVHQQFGPEVLTSQGELNRSALAKIVFSSETKRRQLEAILHPKVRESMNAELKKHRGKVAVCDIPLLFETGRKNDFDFVVVVDALNRVRIARLKKKGFLLSDIQRRMKAQLPLKDKVRRADFVIDNSHTLKNTQAQVDKFWASLK